MLINKTCLFCKERYILNIFNSFLLLLQPPTECKKLDFFFSIIIVLLQCWARLDRPGLKNSKAVHFETDEQRQ